MMPASAAKKKKKKNGKRINFNAKKELNSILIQNDKILVIF